MKNEKNEGKKWETLKLGNEYEEIVMKNRKGVKLVRKEKL